MARISLGQGVFMVGFLLAGCGKDSKSSADGGAGAAATGATGSGAAGSGGAATGGSARGGATSGGRATGGANSGGSWSGGSTTGGSADDGGTPSGGARSGGSHSGGIGTGGSHSGRATTGGARTGGTGAGGAQTGGTIAGGDGGDAGLPTGGTLTGGEGGAPAGGAKTGGAGGAGGGAMMGCYVGVQADDCCSRPVAADSRALGDPCFVAYEDVSNRAMLESSCPDAAICRTMNCTYEPPPSRVVTRDDTGTCVFTDECDPDTDPCIVAIDYHDCCACPEMLPRALVQDDPCIATSDEPAPTGCIDCSAISCGTCRANPPAVTCETRGEVSLLTCVPSPSV